VMQVGNVGSSPRKRLDGGSEKRSSHASGLVRVLERSVYGSGPSAAEHAAVLVAAARVRAHTRTREARCMCRQ
jgi:hypothetical protein